MFTVRKVSGEGEEGLVTEVPQANMVRLGLRDHRAQKVFREIRDLLVLRAIRALKDPRAILVNPSQPLLLFPLRRPRW